MTESTLYGTQKELDYLSRIGTFSPSAVVANSDRAQMLEGYLAGARARKDWGKMDGGKVIAFAEQQLRKEQRK